MEEHLGLLQIQKVHTYGTPCDGGSSDLRAVELHSMNESTYTEGYILDERNSIIFLLILRDAGRTQE